MREILFRGKGLKFLDWHEGELINTAGKIPPYMPMILKISENGQGEAYDVDPATVGQFTGLTDKNGKRIFEGDIVRCISPYCDRKEVVGHIIFGECCFCVKKGINSPAMDLCDDFEIIGNIHDNPELLDGGDAG